MSGAHTNTKDLSEKLREIEHLFYGSESHFHIASGQNSYSQHLEQILEHFTALGSLSEQARALLLLSMIADTELPHAPADHLVALEKASAALHLSQKAGDYTQQGRALWCIGEGHFGLGDYLGAKEYYLQALELAEQSHDLTCQWQALRGLLNAYLQLDEQAEARAVAEQAFALADDGGHATLQVMAECYLAEVLAHTEPQHASYHAKNAMNSADEWGLDILKCRTRLCLAEIKHRLGQTEEAEDLLHVALQVAQNWHSETSTQCSWIMLGKTWQLSAALSTEVSNRKQALKQSLEAYEKAGQYQEQSEILSLMIELEENQHNYSDALRLTRKKSEVALNLAEQRANQQHKRLALQIKEDTRKELFEIDRKRRAELADAKRALHSTQTELKRREIHDSLTGLVNRSYFQQRIHKLLELLEDGENLGLLYLDVDHLKNINEKYGYSAGDSVIQEVAERLRGVIRSGDLATRWDGDEFMLLLGHLAQPEDIDLVAQKVLQVMREPFDLADFSCTDATDKHLTISVGGVVAPEDGQSLELLDQHVYLALQQAQQKGRDTFERFQPYMSVAEQERRSIENELRLAVSQNQLNLHYQGQFGLPGRSLTGFEALVRWQHPRLGIVSPARFIPLAEETGLILEIGLWVLQEACRQAAEWNFGKRQLAMAVNVSAKQFGQHDFVKQVKAALEMHNLPVECLVLEVTESMVHHDPHTAQYNIRALQELGVSIAMDDFGIGYSSLSMLQNLPFQYLKIDRSFLMNLTEGYAKAKLFMEVMVQLAHNLSMHVVAEGVETEEQWRLLCELGYDTAQGYHMARPMPAEQVIEMLPPLPNSTSSS